MKRFVIGAVIGSLIGLAIAVIVPKYAIRYTIQKIEERKSQVLKNEIAWCEQVKLLRQQQGLTMTGFIWGSYCRDIQDISIDYQVRSRMAMSERASDR